MLKTIDEFVARVSSLADIGDAYDVFEDECSADLRKSIYSFADEDSVEPFRSAMYNLGFKDY